MIEYYKEFVDVKFITDNISEITKCIDRMNRLHQNENIKRQCFEILHNLNHNDIQIMGFLKEEMGRM